MKALARLVHRFSTDDEFRQALTRDMETTLRRAGIALSSEDRRVLQHLLDVLSSPQRTHLYDPTPDLPGWTGYRDLQVIEAFEHQGI